MNDNRDSKVATIASLLQLLDLGALPNYWWSDYEIAAIGNHYNFD